MRQACVLKRVSSAVALAVAALCIGGCDVKSFIDPSEMFPDTKKTLQKPILTSLSSIDPSIDDPDDEFLNATDVQPMDRQVVSQDYKIGKGDLVTISVNDLVGLGVETTKQTRVSESGNVSMPLIGQIHAEGMTEDELQKSIADAYRNGQIITNAQVSVTVAEARARTFSALGAVGTTGEYGILRSDFRLLDALVLVHDVVQTADTIYIIRQISEDPGAGGKTGTTGTPQQSVKPIAPPPGVDPLAPHPDSLSQVNHVAMLQTAPDPLAARPTTDPSSSAGFAFAPPAGPTETRTIRVPLDAVRRGDFRYNIVIRPHDLIIAPNPIVGEYYMGGHVARTGVYSLANRQITLKEAVVGTGMLDGLAIPERTEIIRRLGKSREAFVFMNLNAVFSGTQPDIYLKPYDTVLVGTNILAPFISAIRGGFRITYGFGFLYDRNYAPQQAVGS